jgi:DNA-binding transcriptional regulator YiaG
MGQTTSSASEGQSQDFQALVREMRKRLMLSSEQFADRLYESPLLIYSWQYFKRKPSKKAQAQLKKVLVEMGELGSDLIQTYCL